MGFGTRQGFTPPAPDPTPTLVLDKPTKISGSAPGSPEIALVLEISVA